MNDPWGSFQNFMNDFSKLSGNPAQFAMQRMGVSQEIANNPDAILQELMSSGKVSQAQYNAARNAAMKIQNNPMFRMMMKK